MRKRILILIFTALIMSSTPVHLYAMEPETAVEQVDAAVSISINRQTVSVTGAQGLKLEVVSLTGRVVKTFLIDEPAQSFELNISKGCYILKVGKVVRKVSVC